MIIIGFLMGVGVSLIGFGIFMAVKVVPDMKELEEQAARGRMK